MKKVSAELPQLHHLSRDGKGRWEIRLTIDEGERFVGRRVRIKLGNVEEIAAIRERDLVLAAYQKAGVSVRMRAQKTRKFGATR